jgi:transporter family protein
LQGGLANRLAKIKTSALGCFFDEATWPPFTYKQFSYNIAYGVSFKTCGNFERGSSVKKFCGSSLGGGVVWVIFALLSAFFAALTSILAKVGIENVNSNLATAIRTLIVFIMSWAIVFITGKHSGIVNIGHKNVLFLIFSGITTGLSWLCYYKALQIGDASKVIPVDKFSLVIGMAMAFIILKEAVTIKTIIGGVLITIGTFVLLF